MTDAPILRRGQRVTYTGRTTPNLRGRSGIVVTVSTRNGWTTVRFDGVPGTVKCSEYNLSPRDARPVEA